MASVGLMIIGVLRNNAKGRTPTQRSELIDQTFIALMRKIIIKYRSLTSTNIGTNSRNLHQFRMKVFSTTSVS